MRTSTPFGAKNVGFYEIYFVSARTRWGGGGEPVQTRGRGQFCADPFMDGPLLSVRRVSDCYLQFYYLSVLMLQRLKYL